jgi:hypothetical protein
VRERVLPNCCRWKRSGRCGSGSGDGREDGAVLGCGGDGWEDDTVLGRGGDGRAAWTH